MYVTIWIEGEKNLMEFCQKRFKEKPKFCETIGHCGDATIYLIYKYKEGYGYTQMFFLFMRHESGTVSDGKLNDMQRMTYEEIRSIGTSILNG